MPQATLNFPDSVSTLLPSVANNFAGAGMCRKGNPALAYSYDPGQASGVAAELGDGMLTEWTIAQLKYGGRSVTVFPLTPSTQGAIGAISKNGGSGPTIVAAALEATGDILIDGPYDSLHIAVRIIGGGAEGVGKFQTCVDDQVDATDTHIGAWSGDITIPAAMPAEIVGTIDLSTIVLSGLNNRTFVGQSNGPVSALHTFTTPADVDALVSQLNGAFSGIDFDLVGANKLRMRSATAGEAGSLGVGVGVSAANAILGFTPSAIVSSTPAVLTGSVDLTTIFGGPATLDGDTFIVTSDLGVSTTTFALPGLPAVLTGSVDLTTLMGAYGGGGSLDTKTFIVTSDLGLVTTTFVTPTDAADLVSQINTAASGDFIASLSGSNHLVLTTSTLGAAASLLIGSGNSNSTIGFTGGGQTDDGEDPLVADIIDQINADATGKFVASLNGSDHLVLTGITTSWLGTLLIGAGTANGTLGFAGGGQTDTGESVLTPDAFGSAATYEIPSTGVVLTFPSGTYVGPTTASPTTEPDYYTFDTTAPRIAPAAIPALFTRVQAAISAGSSVGAFQIVQEDGDTIDGRSMADAFSSALTTARGLKFLFWGLYQATMEATDADVLLRMGSFVDRYLPISAGDFRSAGGNLPGSRFQRPPSWLAARKAARGRFSSDLGNHEDGALDSSLGMTAIGRDERTESTKLALFRTPQRASGGGFLVLESLANSPDVYFYQGRTMAPNGSIYGDLSAVRILLASGRQIQKDLDLSMNSDPPLTKTGLLTDSAKATLENRYRTGLNFVLFPADPEVPDGHASAIGAIVPLYTVSTKTLSATFQIQRRGIVKDIVASIGVTDTLTPQES
jgi:hypothetical protein